MAHNIRETTVEIIESLDNHIAQVVQSCASLEEAAQRVTNFLFEVYEDSIMMIRFFATIPFHQLPVSTQRAANTLAEAEGITALMRDDTPVLTLLGARGGVEMQNVKLSFGIPLVSPEFIASIPMIAELLTELGFPVNGQKRMRPGIGKNGDFETTSISFLSGIFYVPDAQHAVNARGEKIISAVDRIAACSSDILSKVQTIFGIGGAYIQGSFMTIIVFSRESLDRKTVELFMPVAKFFKTSTIKLVMKGKFFHKEEN